MTQRHFYSTIAGTNISQKKKKGKKINHSTTVWIDIKLSR